MFGFFKKNSKNNSKDSNEQKNILELVSPVSGTALPLSEVPDPVFAQKMAGDGVAVLPSSDVIVAPADGELTLVFKTKHAFAMTLANGIELLVHIGIETVSLNGEGFEQLVEQGTTVKAGTPIIKIDREFITSKNLPLVTPILVTNMDSVKSISATEQGELVAGETKILTITI